MAKTVKPRQNMGEKTKPYNPDIPSLIKKYNDYNNNDKKNYIHYYYQTQLLPRNVSIKIFLSVMYVQGSQPNIYSKTKPFLKAKI